MKKKKRTRRRAGQADGQSGEQKKGEKKVQRQLWGGGGVVTNFSGGGGEKVQIGWSKMPMGRLLSLLARTRDLCFTNAFNGLGQPLHLVCPPKNKSSSTKVRQNRISFTIKLRVWDRTKHDGMPETIRVSVKACPANTDLVHECREADRRGCEKHHHNSFLCWRNGSSQRAPFQPSCVLIGQVQLANDP